MACLKWTVQSSQATSRTKFKDDMWLEACSERCGKNLPSKNWYLFSCLFYFPQVIYSISSSAALQWWRRKKQNASTVEDKSITPTRTLHNLITQGIPDATIATQHTPEEHQKTTDGKMLVGFGMLQKSETSSCLYIDALVLLEVWALFWRFQPQEVQRVGRWLHIEERKQVGCLEEVGPFLI